jgi:hypothetical protein
MKHQVLLLALLGGLSAASAQAETATAQKLADKYTATAKAADPKWTGPTVEEGKTFYTREVIQFKGDTKKTGKAIACASCHTANPADAGKHIITGKKIAPLSPAINAKRFADLDKVEKGFTKHCQEVVGSDCTPAEKASYITYVMSEQTPGKQ